MEKKAYVYKGPVMLFDTCVERCWTAETWAVSMALPGLCKHMPSSPSLLLENIHHANNIFVVCVMDIFQE